MQGESFLVHGLELFHPRLGPLLLIAVAARHRTHDHPNEKREDGEEQNDPEPGSEGGARLFEAELWFFWRHG